MSAFGTMQSGFGNTNEPQFPPMDPGDDRLFVQFYLGSIKNEEKTLEEGRPVFDAVPFVKIMVPGDKNTMIDTRVSDQHKRRFARLWHQFEQSQTQELSGTPLRDWPGVTRAQAEELNYLNVYTVEQLASLADVYGTRIMGFNDLKRKAATYIEQAKDAAFAQRLADVNAQQQAEIDALHAEVKRLSDLFETLKSGKAKDDDSTGTRANRSG